MLGIVNVSAPMYRRKKTGGGVLVATLCHPIGSTFIHKTKFSVLVKYVLVKGVSQAHPVLFLLLKTVRLTYGCAGLGNHLNAVQENVIQ